MDQKLGKDIYIWNVNNNYPIEKNKTKSKQNKIPTFLIVFTISPTHPRSTLSTLSFLVTQLQVFLFIFLNTSNHIFGCPTPPGRSWHEMWFIYQVHTTKGKTCSPSSSAIKSKHHLSMQQLLVPSLIVTCYGFVWLELAQVLRMLSLLLGVHACVCLIHSLSLQLPTTCGSSTPPVPFLAKILETWESVWSTNAPLWADPSSVISFLYIGQVGVCLLITIFCKLKLLCWRLKDALIN